MTRRQYKNPPIEESLCEFRFTGGSEWDLAVPAALQERLRSEYVGKPRPVATNVTVGSTQAPVATMAMVTGLTKLQFPDADGKRLVSIAPNLLSVHVLRPYSGWEDFRRRISSALDAYRAVCAPASVARLGVRYINRVVIPDRNVQMRQYFLCEPPPVDGLPGPTASFVHRAEYRYDDGARLFVTCASIDGSGAPEFLLDLDVILEPAVPFAVDGVMKLVEDLRTRERVAFEAVITDKSREMFDV